MALTLSTYVYKSTGMSPEYVRRCRALGVKYHKFITEWHYMPQEHWQCLRDHTKDERYFACWDKYDWKLMEEKVQSFMDNFDPEMDDTSIDCNVEDPVSHLWWWKPKPIPPGWNERDHRREPDV